jgi:hypothetical protein
LDEGLTIVDLSTIYVEPSPSVADAATTRGLRGAVIGTPGVLTAGTQSDVHNRRMDKDLELAEGQGGANGV